ncbi:MAG: TonB-dependent receptor [Bacteroidota bacterium]|nr:TonB-dependent receptor [Bacteroidota bacterium]
MKKYFRILTALFAILPIAVFSQHSLSGKVYDARSGEPLPGAHVIIKNTFKTAVTDAAGAYSFSGLNPGTYTLRVSYISFEEAVVKIQLDADKKHNFRLQPRAVMTEEVIISASRVGEKSPATYENVTREEIEAVNFGQDLPYLIETTPSTVVSSDAGTGIGYTNLRIRGTDITRINVTINGIPLNDPESQGVFWVNMPDFATSVDNIQIQRGVGTSVNGAAAFGASINIQTLDLRSEAYAEIRSTAGSFNTFRNNVSFGTGLIGGHWSFNGRLSKITSDGYIDRAWSDLKSFYFSGGYHGEKTMVKAVIFSGVEHTYQSWWGVPKVRLENDYEGMKRYYDHWLYTKEEYEHMLNSDSRTYNYYTYENETDNYQQDHYQLHISHQFNKDLYLSASGFYVYGRGYYEQYRNDDDFADYELPPVITGNDTISSSNLVRRKWLDNDYYGANFSLNYKLGWSTLITGGSWNFYDGRHFGNIIWSEYAVNMNKDYEWYRNTGKKNVYSAFARINSSLTNKLNAYLDLQYRGVDYKIDGIHDDLRDISQENIFNFFNPKAGLYYDLNENNSVYFSVGVANREPSRSNYRDADSNDVFKSERLLDFELGYSMKKQKYGLEANLFYMDYKDQLVLTGELNDVGAAIMTNVPESYRAGIEVVGGVKILEKLDWKLNATFSQNKIRNFVEYVDDWDYSTGEPQISKELGTTGLAFSPGIIAGNRITYELFEGLKLSFISKYVGRQYIDNTSSRSRSLNPYFVNDLLINYSFKTKFIDEISFHLMINNLFNEEYETYAWVYRYIYSGEYWEMDGYFPQAGINVLGGLTLSF